LVSWYTRTTTCPGHHEKVAARSSRIDRDYRPIPPPKAPWPSFTGIKHQARKGKPRKETVVRTLKKFDGAVGRAISQAVVRSCGRAGRRKKSWLAWRRLSLARTRSAVHLPFGALSSMIRPFAISARTTEVAWQSYANRERPSPATWGRSPHLDLAGGTGGVLPHASTLDEEGVDVAGPALRWRGSWKS
jgi:hypothetical protein